MRNINSATKVLRKQLKTAQTKAIKRGLSGELLHQYNYICNFRLNDLETKKSNRGLIAITLSTLILLVLSVNFVNSILSIRCLLPSNYLVWEATRPLADCGYCQNVTKPIILWNVTRHKFSFYAYTSGPIVVKNAVNHWRATKEFSFNMFKKLYENTIGGYESLEEGCQFLNFKTDLFSLKEVFNMPEDRAQNKEGEKPWYVGWGNCHPNILAKVRQYYTMPEFLPNDVEFPATENIFFGFETGAVMHLDYISRLMWQGQVQGTKTWSIAPVPECDHVCHKFDFYVEQGDIVLLDTRIWYHATRIPKGQFSMTVQSEYG